MAFQTIPLPLFVFSAACTTPFAPTLSVLCIRSIHKVVKSTIQANGSDAYNLEASAAIAEANCFGIGHAIGDDLFRASVERPAVLLDSRVSQGDCCQ